MKRDGENACIFYKMCIALDIIMRTKLTHCH